MVEFDLNALVGGDDAELRRANRWLETLSAEQRAAWTLEHLPVHQVMSSSFGTQSAVMLHMITRLMPDIPVIFLDTGYLFAETYRLVDELRERLDLNLKVCRPSLSPAWQEARLGKLWEQGRAGLDEYNRINKIEPMERALEDLGAKTWLAGLRRDQSRSRAELAVLRRQDGRMKIHPIVDWTAADVRRYMRRHDLPEHPLQAHGFVSVGDVHTTRVLLPGMLEEETRFFGIKRECGLHR